jgi:hypothetical protein
LGDAEPIVKLDTEDRIATVTLHRPAARNALSRAMIHAPWGAVTAAGADPGTRPGRDRPVPVPSGHRQTGLLAETWLPGTSQPAARRADVIARGHAQVGHAD